MYALSQWLHILPSLAIIAVLLPAECVHTAWPQTQPQTAPTLYIMATHIFPTVQSDLSDRAHCIIDMSFNFHSSDRKNKAACCVKAAMHSLAVLALQCNVCMAGMTQEDIEEYMASGRLEPNLHIFTNPQSPPYGSDLEHAQQASWLAFLAAKDSTDAAVWNAADAAGDNLLRAYAEADTSDDDEARTSPVALLCLTSVSKWRNY